jgi:hypothetical protein
MAALLGLDPDQRLALVAVLLPSQEHHLRSRIFVMARRRFGHMAQAVEWEGSRITLGALSLSPWER